MTPERALVERIKQTVQVQWHAKSYPLGMLHGHGLEVLWEEIAAFAAGYAREQREALVEAITKEHGARHGIQPAMGPCPYITCVAVAKLVTS